MLDEHGGPRAYMAICTDISERKRIEAEVAEINRRLIEASRQAGMADVAAGILHDVGNVLNSVNVSAHLMAERARHSKQANFAKAVALLDKQAADLGRFLATDPQGVRLPGYLRLLSEHLAHEQETNLAELATLCRHIEFINDILAKQRSFAHGSVVIETLGVPDLVADALRMTEASLQKHGIVVRTEFEAPPAVSADKYKVLQILVNLLRNAEQACNDSGRPDKTLLIHAGEGAGGTVKIAITDNGAGISPENLTRIFSHGFITRATGPGFGLHDSANAAREMGGKLIAQSAGPGTGATFILELPHAQRGT
jgi:C4-dicarboxylate-specific signal transduction histidine kinase